MIVQFSTYNTAKLTPAQILQMTIEATPVQLTNNFTETIVFHAGGPLFDGVGLLDQFILDTILSSEIRQPYGTINESIKYYDQTLIAFLTRFQTISESLVYADHIYQLVEDGVSDGVVFDASLSDTVNRIARILEQIDLAHETSGGGEFINTLVSLLVLTDLVNRAFGNKITEEVVLDTDLKAMIEAYSKITNTILFSESTSNIFSLVISDAINFNDSTNTLAVLKNIITDQINFVAGLDINGQEYLVYAVNTQSTGISQYTNYDFNSFAYPLACASDGIYLLGGDSDDGTNIDASIKTGLYDFGTSLKKRMNYAYLGITSTGRVVMKVTNTDSGVKKEHWYEVNTINEALDTTRVQFGKGPKGKYWQFEIINTDGADLELESLEVLPVVLSRKV